MSSRFSHTSSFTKLIIVIEFCLVAYLLYSLTKNVYNSYKVDQYIATFEEENASIEIENKQKTQDFLYFTSEEYIDKIAKQNLGLINPGEEVIVLTSRPADEKIVGSEVDTSSFAKSEESSNPKLWWNFFFGS